MVVIILDNISKNILENEEYLKKMFEGDSTFITRPVRANESTGLKCRLFFCDGMVSTPVINESIVKPLSLWDACLPTENRAKFIRENIIHSNDVKLVKTWQDVLKGILYGDTALFCDGTNEVLVINTKGFTVRGISEPGSEQILTGPREGFIEGIMVNLSLIRRRLRTENLKFTFKELGGVSKTTCCVCYIDGIADEQVLKELNKRLSKINIDGILSANYIGEIISDNLFSPVKTIGNTERPDVVASKLLEGRIAIIVDGTPVVLTLPYILSEQFQSSEDYYVNYFFGSLSRLLRIFGFIFSISILPLYISLITFHPEMMPTSLLLSISAARDNVPLPTIVEALALLFVFEILREAGTRTPTVVGQTIGIVGALVLGQAAVEARFVSSPMIIIVAFSGICGLMVPKLRSLVSIGRIILLALSSMMGLYGYIFGMVWLLTHLASTYSFGISVLSNITSYHHGSKKDTFWRTPWRYMKPFDRFIAKSRGEK